MPYLVQHLLRRSSLKYPNNTAISCPFRGPVSYADLEASSNRLANALRSTGIPRRGRVAICMRRSAAYVEAIFGILKADGAYVPMHHKLPAPRVIGILRDCGAHAIITDAHTFDSYRDALQQASVETVIVLDPLPVGSSGAKQIIVKADIDLHRADDTPAHNIDVDLAEVIYTSGSTGSPKGVMICHRNLVDYMAWAVSHFSIQPSDRILSTAPFNFDMSTFDIFAPLSAGARLCITTDDDLLFPAKLADRIHQERATIWKSAASLLGILARARIPETTKLESLVKIAFSGERLPSKYIAYWMRSRPGVEFYNVYGPTEATGVSSAFRILDPPDPCDDVPIGRPCTNTEIILLDHARKPVKPGHRGEIHIGGSCLSLGYLNDQAKTNQRFIEYDGMRLYRTGDLGYLNDAGDLVFAGRMDDQIKYLGHRVEIGEILAALNALPMVADSAVTLANGRLADIEELVAFVHLFTPAAAETLHDHLRSKLPPYMIPKRIVLVDSIPRTERGKINFELLRGYLDCDRNRGRDV